VNAHALARYAALCQEAGIVPVVEPEVLQDGTHTIERSYHVTSRVLDALYTELFDQRVDIFATMLKPNMVLSGYEASHRASHQEVGDWTLKCFYRHVPAAVPGIVFLSGGQSDEDATAKPECDEREGLASMGTFVLVRSRAAIARAEGVGRQAGELRGWPAGLLPPREDELGRAHRDVRASNGAGGRRSLTAGV
jgi:fructose-bisphosphate aldolase class 1